MDVTVITCIASATLSCHTLASYIKLHPTIMLFVFVLQDMLLFGESVREI